MYFKLNNPTIGAPIQPEALRGQYVEVRTLDLARELGDPQYCAWSADGNSILVSHEDEEALVLNGNTLNLVNQFQIVRYLA